MTAPARAITDEEIGRYRADGAVMLPGLFDLSWVERLRGATERAVADDGAQNDEGFVRNRDMWMRDEDFRAYVFEIPAAEIARALMRSPSARLYFDHLFVKEPGSELPTPWHQDLPYWPASGGQIVSIWLALDDVTRASSGLVYVRGSHLAGKRYRPVAFATRAEYTGALDPDVMPDIDADPDAYDLLSWDMKAGDCIVHDSLAIHGASGNSSTVNRRRALSTRWADEHVRFDPKPGMDPVLCRMPLEPGAPLGGEGHPLIVAG